VADIPPFVPGAEALAAELNVIVDAVNDLQWTPYTPQLQNWTLGDGNMVAAYAIMGGWVFDQMTITFGAGATFEGSLNVPLPVPTNIEGASTVFLDGHIMLAPASSINVATWRSQGTSAMVCMYPYVVEAASPRSLQLGNVSGTKPISMVAGSIVTRRGMYRV
jgi:hypothetical protein